MKKKIKREEALEKIKSFFLKKTFSSEETKKIKRLAMKLNIKLGEYRKKFCKKCLSKLSGKTRISKKHKIVFCNQCGYKNKFRID